MKKLILLAATALAFPVAANAVPTLNIEAFDNGAPIALTCAPSNPSTGGSESCVESAVGNFTTLTISATGVGGSIPAPDLSTVTLDAVAGAISGTHILTLDIFQTGISAPAGNVESTFTANSLIGSPGPHVETTYYNGTGTTLGTQLSTFTFGAGVVDGASPPQFAPAGSPIIADAQSYAISFSATGESANDTIEMIGVVPEPASLVLLGTGLIGLGAIVRRRRRS